MLTYSNSQMDSSTHPLVSWVICTHLVDDQVRRALQSCLDQTYTNIEVVLVCNGPEAEQAAESIIQWFDHDERLRVFTTPIRYLTFSLSLGIHHAKGEFIARMDADDISKPERLSLQVAFLKKHPAVGVLGSAYEVIDESGAIISIKNVPTTDRAIRSKLVYSNPICHPSVMLRRSLVLQAGGYLGSIYAQDYDLWSRLVRDHSVQFANLSEPLLQYRSKGVGTARKAKLAYAAVAAAQVRNFASDMGWNWLLATGRSIISARFRAK